MATSIANYYCLLSRCSGMIRSIALTGQLGSKCVRNRNLFRRCFYPSLSYGSRAADGTQDGQVDVPVDRLTISYSRSSGPGGQNVNKVSTKAEVRFHVRRADWIPEDVKLKIILKNKNRINKAGELLVTSELSRNQQRNLGDCIQKISDIIAEASEKPHEPSTEDIALRASRLERRNQERLKQKKIQSAIKQTRRVDFD